MSLPPFRRIVVLTVAAAALPFVTGPPAAAEVLPGPVAVTVMSRNLYLGSDLAPVFDALTGNPLDVPAAMGQAWANVQATDFPARAELLADEIQAADPDLIGLQEVALWRIQTPSDTLSLRPRSARTVRYDFLKILQRALRARGLFYKAVSFATAVDIEFPAEVGDGLSDVRYTDRNVILARRGIPTSRPRRATFDSLLTLDLGALGLAVKRNWVSIDATVGGRKFRFIDTHLELEFEIIQRAQLAQILAGPASTDLPVVLVGDLNCDPANDHAVAVYDDAIDAGFVDSWTEVTAAPGLTWGHAELLDDAVSDFTWRLDYVLHTAGLTATAAEVVGEGPADRVGGFWPSDHAGVVVELLFP